MNESHPRHSLQPGRELHWYRIERILGQGGFGITYLAHDANLALPVAIKEYMPLDLAVRHGATVVQAASDAHAERYRWGLERFIAEGRTLARFRHPSIVRVLSVFEANNTAYMVMEYEHGESLQQLLERRRTLPEDELMRLLNPLLDGLAEIHAQGFIHRDIKPANVYLRGDGRPVLLDFGSARQALGERTRTLTSVVSPGYAPFEQYYSRSDRQGPWTDIYGLGATLYRCLSGVAPMTAIDRSEAIIKTSRDLFVAASEIGAERYSRGFLAAVDRALAFDEEQRPQSIAEWRREFGAPPVVPMPARARRIDHEDVTRIATHESEPALEQASVVNIDVRSARHARRRDRGARPGYGWLALCLGCALLVGLFQALARGWSGAVGAELRHWIESTVGAAAPPMQDAARTPVAHVGEREQAATQVVPLPLPVTRAPVEAMPAPPQPQPGAAPNADPLQDAVGPLRPIASPDAIAATETATGVDVAPTMESPLVAATVPMPDAPPIDPQTRALEQRRLLAAEIADEEAAVAALPRVVIDFDGFEAAYAALELTPGQVLARVVPVLRGSGYTVVSREQVAAHGGDWRRLALLVYRLQVREDAASGRYAFTGGLEALGKQALAQELDEALAGGRLWSRGQSGYGEARDLTEVLEYYSEMTRALIEAGSLAQP